MVEYPHLNIYTCISSLDPSQAKIYELKKKGVVVSKKKSVNLDLNVMCVTECELYFKAGSSKTALTAQLQDDNKKNVGLFCKGYVLL